MVYAKFGRQTECIMGNWKIENWWDELREAGPPLGYYPNSKKCWLIVKPEKEGRAKEMFAGTGINITTEGCKHLGAALGSRSYLEQYVGGKVEDWVGEVTRLQRIMTTVGTRGFSRLLRKFSVLAEGRHIFGHGPKPRAATETGNHARKVAGTQGKS